MKRLLVFLFIFVLFFSVAKTSNAILFDFDNLKIGDKPPEIETYMESIYGSDIRILNAVTDDGYPIIPDLVGGQGVLHDYPGDKYLQNQPSNGVHWFVIEFREIPITSVSFDWGTRNEYNGFYAYADGVNIFSDVTLVEKKEASGNTQTINFADLGLGAVTALGFSDGGIGEIEIDNLEVTPIPEPAILSYICIGLLGLTSLKKRF